MGDGVGGRASVGEGVGGAGAGGGGGGSGCCWQPAVVSRGSKMNNTIVCIMISLFISASFK
ncbi:hypothetical protein ES703_120875 [subsurface metagenome]